MKLKAGQTMIELMIALAIIVIGLFAAMDLVYSNLALVNRDSDEVTAINLAREGVELAKETRDSNWLAGNAFDQGLYKTGTPSDYTGTVVWTGTAGTTPSFDFTADTLADANAKIVLSNGMFQQTGVSGSSTLFARLLVFHPICNTGSPPYVVKNPTDVPDTCAAGTKIGVRVESDVRWTRNNTQRDEVVYDDLYDWR